MYKNYNYYVGFRVVIVLYVFSLDIFVLPLFAEKQFHCFTPDSTYSHTWRVNGTVVNSNSTFPDEVYITSQTLSNGSIQWGLTFIAYANNTDIECFVTNGVHILPQLKYTIVIQGIYIIYSTYRSA